MLRVHRFLQKARAGPCMALNLLEAPSRSLDDHRGLWGAVVMSLPLDNNWQLARSKECQRLRPLSLMMLMGLSLLNLHCEIRSVISFDSKADGLLLTAPWVFWPHWLASPASSCLEFRWGAQRFDLASAWWILTKRSSIQQKYKVESHAKTYPVNESTPPILPSNAAVAERCWEICAMNPLHSWWLSHGGWEADIASGKGNSPRKSPATRSLYNEYMNAWCKDRLCKELWTCRCRGCCISRWKGSVNHLCNSYCRQNSRLKSTFETGKMICHVLPGSWRMVKQHKQHQILQLHLLQRDRVWEGAWQMGNGTWDETLKRPFLTKDDESTMRQSGLEVTILFLSRYSKLQVWHDLTLINSVWISLTLLVNMFWCQGCSTFIRGSQISLMIFWELGAGKFGAPQAFYTYVFFILFIRSNMFVKLAYLQARSKLTILQAGPEAIAGEAAAKLFLVQRPIVVAKACRVANGSVAFETQKHLWCDFQLRNIFRYIGDYLHLLGTACLAMFLLSQFWKVVVLCIPQQLLSSSVAVSASAVLGGHATSRWQTFMSFLAVHKY